MTRTITAILVASAAGVLVSCAGPTATDVSSSELASRRILLDGTPNLVECPTAETSTASGVVTPLGGIVSLNGTNISIPAGALLSSATVTVTLPASNLMEVDISVEGAEHFVFELPVTVTLSYGRCDRDDIDKSPLTVWYIDSETKSPLEAMGGIDNKLLGTVTFTTGHLSGYAVAN